MDNADAAHLSRSTDISNIIRKDPVPIDPAVIGILNTPGVVEYFSGNAHRLAAFRALLELLAIPFPRWAERNVSGRAAARRDLIAAFREEHRETLHERTMRMTSGLTRSRTG